MKCALPFATPLVGDLVLYLYLMKNMLTVTIISPTFENSVALTEELFIYVPATCSFDDIIEENLTSAVFDGILDPTEPASGAICCE